MSIFPEKTIKGVLKKLKVTDVLKAINYRTDTIQEMKDDTIKCFCPIHQEQVFRTLILNTKDKSYRCSYSLCPGNKGGDVIALYAKAKKLDYDDALSELVQNLNLDVNLPTTQEFIDKTVEVAENYLELGVLDDSEVYFKKVVGLQPLNLRCHLGLLEVYNQKGMADLAFEEMKTAVDILMAEHKFQDALGHIQKYLETAPDSLEFRRKLIDCYTELGRVDECYGEYMNLADLYEMNNDFDSAIDVYRKLEKLNLDIIDIYSHIINLLIASNRIPEVIDEALKRVEKFRDSKSFEEALETLDPILDLDKSRTDIRHLYIDLALESGTEDSQVMRCLKIVNDFINDDAPAEAIFALKRILAVVPENTDVTLNLIDVYLLQGNENEAKNSLIFLSDIFLKKSDSKNSLKQLDRLLSLQADNLPALIRKSEIFIKNNENENAIETLKIIVDTFRAQSKYSEAVPFFQKIIDLDPENINLRTTQVDLDIEAGDFESAYQRSLKIVDIYITNGDKESAIGRLKFALDLKPEITDVRVMLADLLNEFGKKEDAKTEYFHTIEDFKVTNKPSMAIVQIKKILEFDPKETYALETLGEIYTELKDNIKAIQTYRDLYEILKEYSDFLSGEKVLLKIIDLQPDDLAALNELVYIYRSAKNEDDLIKTYEKLAELYNNKGAFGKVAEICEEILSLKPENIFAHKALIRNFEVTGKLEGAINIQLELAEILEKQNDVSGQRDCFEYILKYKPQSLAARKKYAFLLYSLNEKGAAFNQLEALIEQLVFEKNFSEAIDILNVILINESDNPALHLKLISIFQMTEQTQDLISQTITLINLYQKLNKLDEVVKHYKILLDLEEENIIFRTNLIETYLKLSDTDEAIDEYFKLAEQYSKHNNSVDAENIYHEILLIDSYNERAHEALIALYKEQSMYDKATRQYIDLSNIQESQGKHDDAIINLLCVFEYDPDNIEIYRKLIDIDKQQKKVDEVLKYYSQVFEIYKQKNKIDDAIKIQREAIEYQSDKPALRRILINTLVQNTQVPEAVAELFHLADYFTKSADFTNAIAAYTEIVSIDGTNVKARKQKAELLNKLGNVQGALEEFMAISAIFEKGGAAPAPAAMKEESRIIQSLPIVKDYTFDSFVVGARNNFAFATALAVAKAPSSAYNPLFLYSDVGLGKTHLMHAIANYVIDHHLNLRILYTNTEEFTTELINAIQDNTITQFRNKHKNTDLLLLDDVQFLSGKERAQEEFFHIFNTLFQARKQIVVTSDRPPKDIAHLEKRLRSRFGAGVIVDIQPPDYETRIAILNRELDEYDFLKLNSNLVSIIAEKMETNIRELKGALNQVIAVHQITGEAVSEDMVRRVINSLYEKV